MDLDGYSRQISGMEPILAEIEAGFRNVKLTWTTKWLLSLTAMKTILANQKKETVSVMIRVTNAGYRNMLLMNDILFSNKRYRVDGFVALSPDILCLSCCL